LIFCTQFLCFSSQYFFGLSLVYYSQIESFFDNDSSKRILTFQFSFRTVTVEFSVSSPNLIYARPASKKYAEWEREKEIRVRERK
jgi:hypothetical protein